MTATHPKLMGKLLIETAMGSFLGDRRIRLLEAIDKFGSISQAAKAVPISYKAAWDAVDDMSNVAPEPLVNRSTGGRNGGGTELTAYGRRLITFYRALEQESQLALERLTGKLEQSGVLDVADFRNRFTGTVANIHEGPVNAEVTLNLPGGRHVITAVITDASVKRLGLVVGQPVTAVFKASSVFLVAID